MYPTRVTVAYDNESVELIDNARFRLAEWELPLCPTSQAYSAWLLAGGDPYSFTGPRLDTAPVMLSLVVKNNGDWSDLKRVWQPGATLTWVENGVTRWSRLFIADTPAWATFLGRDNAILQLTGVRHYAYTQKVAYAAQTTDAIGTADFPGNGEAAIPGDRGIPALTAVKTSYAQAVTRAALGVRPDPASDYEPLDDYQGTEDATALSGQCSAEVTLTGTYQGIPNSGQPNVPTAGNRGRVALFARMKSTVTTKTTAWWKAQSRVSGSGISASTPADADPVNPSKGNGEGWGLDYLGDLSVPAAAVPNVDTGSGFAETEAMQAHHDPAVTARTVLNATQSFPVAARCLHTGVRIQVKNTEAVERTLQVTLCSRADGGVLAYDDVVLPANHDGLLRASWECEVSGGDYYWKAHPLDGRFATVLVYGAVGYADGMGGGQRPNDGSIRIQSADTHLGYEEDAWEQITLAGGRLSANGVYSDGQAWVTDTFAPNGTATIQFVGTRLRIYGSKGPCYGIARVALDGVGADVDAYQADPAYVQLLYDTGVLAWGLHVVTWGYTGRKNAASQAYDVTLDTVTVTESPMDFYFESYERAQLGFNTTNQVNGKSSESGKKGQTDFLFRLPVDAGALMWTPEAATTAGEGLYVDNMAESEAQANAYLRNASGGMGPSVLGRCKRWGQVAMWPGVTNRVCSVAGTPADAAPGAVTIQVDAIGRCAALGSVKNE